MAKRRKDQSPSSIKLKQADRSAPTEKTLLQLADDRGLFAQAKEREDAIAKKARTTGTPTLRRIKDDDDDEGDDEAELPPTVERVLETLLWSISLTMLHFTFDVLVQHQYSIDRVVWSKVCVRAGQAFLGGLKESELPRPSHALLTSMLVARSLRHARLRPPPA